MKNEIEFEFGADTSSVKPKVEPVQARTETVERKVEPTFAPQEVQETEMPEVKKVSIREKLEHLECWLKKSSGMAFWLKTKAIFALPAAIILLVVIIIYSAALSKSKAEVGNLNQTIQTAQAQVEEKNAKINELNKEIERLKAANERATARVGCLEREYTRLRNLIPPRQRPQPTPRCPAL